MHTRRTAICNDSRVLLVRATHFPTGLEAVDKLIENESYLAIAQAAVRHGRNSTRLWTNILPRVDSPIAVIVNIRGRVTTSTMRRTHPLPPHPDWQRYGYILTAIFPHDIELDGAHRCSFVQARRTSWIRYGQSIRGEQAEWGFLICVSLKEHLRIRFRLRRKREVFHSVRVTWFTRRNRLRTRADNAGGWGYHFHRADNDDWCKTTRRGTQGGVVQTT